MSTLLGNSFATSFLNDVKKCKKTLVIISPYVSQGAVNQLLQAVPSKVKCTLITVPPGRDYLFGSVEVEALKLLQKKKFDIRTLPNLHAKLYVLDGSTAYLGSANFTASGWFKDGNVEDMIRIMVSKKDMGHIRERYMTPSSPLDLEGGWVEELERQKKIVEEHQKLTEKVIKWEKELVKTPEVKVYYSKSYLPPQKYAYHFRFPITENAGKVAIKNKTDFLFKLGDDGGQILVPFSVMKKVLIEENLSASKVWGIHINFDNAEHPYLICHSAKKSGKIKLNKVHFTGNLEKVETRTLKRG